MTANRVGGPSPSDPDKDRATRMDQHRKIEKVEKVGEVENEQTRKRNKFKKFMEEEPEDVVEKAPSPLEGGFYKKSQPQPNLAMTPPFQTPSPSLGAIMNSVVPDPTHAAPPTANEPPPISTQQPNPLPRNQNFWSSTDTSSNMAPSQNNYNEVEPSGSSKDDDSKQGKKKGHKKTELPIHVDPLKTASHLSPKEKAFKEAALAKERERLKNLEPSPFAPQAPLENSPSGTKKKTLKEEQDLRTKGQRALPQEKREPHLPDAPFQSSHFSHQEKSFSGEEKSFKSRSHPIEIDASSKAQFPSHIIPLAEAATTQSTPYLNPQTIPLFFQMVGTIYMMAGPTGVSRTEIVLNSPSFAHSQFFGSKIVIEKYATAPDALNIRLTGTNEAVTKFQENISSLYAAFQKNDFPFRIGRISAEYSVDKPLFRRKEDKGSAGDQGGSFSDGRGK